MSIKIIKHGQLPGKAIHSAVCYSCGTEFSFQEEDAERVSDQRDGDYWKVSCPLDGCGKFVLVSCKQKTTWGMDR